MNFLVKNGLVTGVPLKSFAITDDCVPCKKGKQHRKSHKSKTVNSIDSPLTLLHMDLFGPVNVKSIGGSSYCLVVTDDFSRFSWVYFLGTKDETTEILIYLFLKLQNLCDSKIKCIRSDNGTEFKNRILELFCLQHGIDHQFSAPRTPQQNGVAERKNRTIVETARTMLADSKLPITFWAEAVNMACYVLNRVLTVKRHNKTCYELFNNRKPNIAHLEPFGTPCTFLNTKDKIGKFDEKAIPGFFLGFVANSPNKRVFNKQNGRVEEWFNVDFSHYSVPHEFKGPSWGFDYDFVFQSFNVFPNVSADDIIYHVVSGEQVNDSSSSDAIPSQEHAAEAIPTSSGTNDASTSGGEAMIHSDEDADEFQDSPTAFQDDIPNNDSLVTGEIATNLGEGIIMMMMMMMIVMVRVGCMIQGQNLILVVERQRILLLSLRDDEGI